MPLNNPKPGQSSESFPSIQEKNLQNLIKVLGTKQSIEALTAIGKMDKETWGNVKDTVKGLKDFVIGGGISAFKEELRQIVKEEALGIFSPILNEFQPIIADLWEAFEPIMPFLVDAVTWIVDILKPIIAFIADGIVAIIEFLTGGSTIVEMFPDIVDTLLGLVNPPHPSRPTTGVAQGGQSGTDVVGRLRDKLEDPYGDY